MHQSVWQGYNGLLPGTYMLNAADAQLTAVVAHGDRNKAFEYVAGKPWVSYNAGQKAHIVENWYKNVMNEGSDTLWPYIRDYIQTGKKPTKL